MPRNVRNFWISGDVDGKQSSIGTGPRSSDGGFDLNIKMRDQGDVSNSEIDIMGRAFVDENGKSMLKLTILENNEEIYTIYRER